MGDYVIDADEMAEGCRFADVVVHKALFIVDIHNPDGAGQAEPTIQYLQTIRFAVSLFSPVGLGRAFWWRDDAYRVLTELTLPIVS